MDIKRKINKERIKLVMKLSIELVEMSFFYLVSRFYKNKKIYKDMWLICERGTEAKDNGYVFFKYLKEIHPEINAYYLIDKNMEKDYDKVKPFNDIIQYKSYDHKIAFFLCKNLISTHVGFIECWNYKLYKMIFDRNNKKKYVFLQHGVTKDDISNFLSKRTTNIDLFVTSTRGEFNSIALNTNYGYKNGEVVSTGLARFDCLNNYSLKNQILLMPTWRENIVGSVHAVKGKDTNKDLKFLESEYYKRYNSLINNRELKELLEKNNIKMIFYPHYEMQQFLKYFKNDNENIIIALSKDYDVQTLLKESMLLLTDYSSVFFDFAYMKKPILYYQFDSGNYIKGYFDYIEDGFGPVLNQEKDIVSEINKFIKNNFEIDDKYKKKVENYFFYNDNNNCKRIYEEIKKIQ